MDSLRLRAIANCIANEGLQNRGNGGTREPVSVDSHPGIREPERFCRSWPWCLVLLAAVVGSSAHAQVVAPFPPDTALDTLEHSGTRYEPGRAHFGSGGSVASAGDVNGDGFPDLLLGADGTGTQTRGAAWLVYGGPRLPPRLSLPNLGERGVLLGTGIGAPETPDRFGSLVAGVGDVDGDGVDDFIVGAPARLDPDFPQGVVFLIFGERFLPSRLQVADLVGGKGLLFHTGSGGGMIGQAGAGIGDVNGDGIADLALGVPDAVTGEPQNRLRTGRLFVVFGGDHLRSLPLLVDLSTLGPPRALEIAGLAEGSRFGAALAGLGDADGDGIDDFAVGSPGHGAGGSVFVVFGRERISNAPDLASLDPAVSVELRSTVPDAGLGHAVAAGRDATGDGLPDLFVGAPEAARDGSRHAGFVSLVPGGDDLHATPVRLLPDDGAFLFHGARGDRAGTSVALVPDLTTDGVAEVLIGAPGRDSNRGAAYLAFGGDDLSGETFPADLTPPFGAKFFHPGQPARLGQSVAGLPDRNGDQFGDLVVGAPDFRSGPTGGGGAVYEIFQKGEPQAPRNLACTPLPKRRTLLTWMVPQLYRLLTIYRDGQPVRSLPGDVLQYVDHDVPGGRHTYVVEADRNPELRSVPCVADVRPLPILDLRCEQKLGTTRVVVQWRPGDEYDALRVLINGSHFLDLDGDATHFEFDLGEGLFEVELRDPTGPDGFRAHCTVEVVGVPTAPVPDFQCAHLGNRRVRLDWTRTPDYAGYLILRNGVRLAVAEGESFVDDGVPLGNVAYSIFGLVPLENGRVQRGPESRCTVLVEDPGGFAVSGRVVFDDRRGALVKRGVVKIHTAGEPIEVQVSAAGEFRATVPDEGPFTITYQLRIPDLLRGDEFGAPPGTGEVAVTLGGVRPDAPATVKVPLPVVAVSSEASLLSLWSPLTQALGNRTLVFPKSLPDGVARGALALDAHVRLILAHLREYLGGAPDQVDLVAYGSAGLAARLYVHTAPEPSVSRLVLLGTPNRGTPRARVELRGELGARTLPGDLEAPDAARYSAAEQQTPEFLAEFNRRITNTRGAAVHLFAGVSGELELNPVLGCELHDSRVCQESALGSFPDATTHVVAEDHARLGRGPQSLGLLTNEVGLGALRRRRQGDGPGAADPAGGGGGGLEDLTFALGKVYSGVLEPSDEGFLPLLADTSGSIIIIFNVAQSAGVPFAIRTPDGDEVDPFTAGAQGVEYLSYVDGEGQTLQTYGFHPGDEGTYTAHIENPAENEPVDYTLEIYVESSLRLTANLDRSEVDLGDEPPLLTATLLDSDIPILGGEITARVQRPDGALDLITLTDDGEGADVTALDGTHSALLPTGDQPGAHLIEISATDGLEPTFERSAFLQLLVRSDAAQFGENWESDVEDDDGDGLHDRLWVRGEIVGNRAGTYLVLGKLTTLDGSPVAETGTVFSLSTPQTTTFTLHFDGEDVYSSQHNGPYVLKEIELIDGGLGFIRADLETDVHQTEDYFFGEFGVGGGTPFRRGDANADGDIDISDAIQTLLFLFGGGAAILCDDAANANDDEQVDVSDPVFLLNFLFLDGPALPPPHPDCGLALKLGCAEYPACP